MSGIAPEQAGDSPNSDVRLSRVIAKVAVLPFTLMNATDESEYLSECLTHDLIEVIQ